MDIYLSNDYDVYICYVETWLMMDNYWSANLDLYDYNYADRDWIRCWCIYFCIRLICIWLEY